MYIYVLQATSDNAMQRSISPFHLLWHRLPSRARHTGEVGVHMSYFIHKSGPIHFFCTTEDGGGGNIPSASKRLLASSRAQVWIDVSGLYA